MLVGRPGLRQREPRVDLPGVVHGPGVVLQAGIVRGRRVHIDLPGARVPGLFSRPPSYVPNGPKMLWNRTIRVSSPKSSR